MQASTVLHLTVVGAFWGCTNPLLRKVASEASGETRSKETEVSNNASFVSILVSSIRKLGIFRVWVPYALNQFGSLIYYLLLSKSDLMLAVPICNALSLVFSFLTSIALGETVDRPIRALLGSTLVMVGVATCLLSRTEGEGRSSASELGKDEL